MTLDFKAHFDVATALHVGGRELQEDAVITDFPVGMDTGYLVLADGMGGHVSGEVASNIVLTEMLAELRFKISDFKTHEVELPTILRHAALTANRCISDFVEDNPSSYGMGATLIASVFVEDRLYWVSVGDSMIYRVRDGVMTRLNADHSLGPEIDAMVARGEMDEEEARYHPDRACLTSVLMGEDIALMDCPARATEVRPGDVFVVASDGLQFLGDDEIAEIVIDKKAAPALEIVEGLLSAILSLADPDQDNVSIAVVKPPAPRMAEVAPPPEVIPQRRRRHNFTRILNLGG